MPYPSSPWTNREPARSARKARASLSGPLLDPTFVHGRARHARKRAPARAPRTRLTCENAYSHVLGVKGVAGSYLSARPHNRRSASCRPCGSFKTWTIPAGQGAGSCSPRRSHATAGPGARAHRLFDGPRPRLRWFLMRKRYEEAWGEFERTYEAWHSAQRESAGLPPLPPPEGERLTRDGSARLAFRSRRASSAVVPRTAERRGTTPLPLHGTGAAETGSSRTDGRSARRRPQRWRAHPGAGSARSS